MISIEPRNDPLALPAARRDTFYTTIKSQAMPVIKGFLLGLFLVLSSATAYATSLITGDAPAPATADLTAAGPSDWIHWGLTSASSINRKAGVTPQISSFTTVGAVANRYKAPAGVRVDYSWSDGTPTASATTTTGVYLLGVGNRFELSVPADTAAKTLTLYAGGYKARGRLDFSLSDGSASPASIIIDNPNDVIDREVTISFAAASAGQSLLITYTLLDDNGVGGNITIAAAALSGMAANQPPTLATIGNKAVTAGQLLSLSVSATDPDGPAPLILTGAPLPAGASFTDNGEGNGQFNWTPSESDVAASPYSVTFSATDGAGALASTSLEITVRSNATKPNIILIMVDDLGYGDLGNYGSSTITTPNLDQLASDGLRFTNFYAAPVCQMARAQLMTGSYSPRVGLSPGMKPRSNFGINPNELTIPELLKTVGYATAIYGKWHLGDAPEFLPTQHGFDEFFGLPYSNDMWPFHPKICPTPDEDPRLTAARERALLTGFAGQNTPCWPTDFFPDLPVIAGDQIVELNPDQSTLNTRYTQEALNFIQRNANQPFFLYLPYTAPHVPLFPDPAFLGSSQADLYGDTVQEVDFHVGQILNELDNLGLANNTLVIFTSDNGPWLAYGIDGGNAGPLQEGKATIFEGGVRVPAIMRWPAEISPGSQSHAIASLLDIFPTVANSAGATIPQDLVIDGKDLTPVLRDPANSTGPRSTLYFFKEAPDSDVDQTLYLRAMRSDQWKLHLGVSGTTITANALYDLETDIGESSNLIASNPTIAQGLVALAQTFNDTLRQNTRPVGIITSTGGSLITGDAPAPASADLTTTGTSDWIHWGLTSASSVDRKAGVTPQISSFTTVGGTAKRYSPPAGARVNFTWSDGTPTASATTTTGVYLQGIGNRFELSVPADTTAKTLTLYAGAYKAQGRLDFSLSDGSASPTSLIIDNPTGPIDRAVTVSFAAASAGQSLRITYTLLNGNNITLAGAALAGGGGTPPANQPPTLATIGNKVVTAGQALSFSILANDPDGPAPLILTSTTLPASATFTDNGGGNGQFDWIPSESDVAASPYSVTFTATENNGAGLSDAETIQITVNSAAGGSGSLVSGDTPAPATADLTATGPGDWIHWGLTSAGSIDRKAGVTPQISSFTTVGAVANRYKAPAGVRVDYTWSDGTPTASASTTTGVYLQGIGNRFELSVPADTTAKTLTLYAGAYKAQGRLDFSLSDGSASPTSLIIDNPTGPIDRAVTVSFAAASAGQSLRITYTLLNGNNITLAGAALAGGGGTPPANQPPTLATIGNKVVTAGQALSFSILANDPDGPAPLILTSTTLPASATFTDNGGGNGQFDWIPSESDVAASPYSVTFTATENNGAGLSDAETIQITVNSAAGGSGSLVSGDTPAPATADLTATGPGDWIHWGLTSAGSIDRKAGVTPQISSFTTVGAIANRYKAPAGVRVDYTWSDGTPTASASTTTGVYLQGIGNRFELSVPADTTAKTLTLYAGAYKAQGRLDFSLSDGSASPTSLIIDNPTGPIDRAVTVSFAAASAGQSLRITYTLLNGNNITLAGAALAGGGGTPPANQPPTLATIGNKVVTAGQALSFSILANDPDGPAPLILTSTTLPASATFTDNGGGNGQFDWIPSESDVAASPYSVTFTATENNGAGLSDAETIQITVNSAAGGSGSLVSGDTPAPATADLTATGPGDWIHWGLTSAGSIDRKAGVTPQISSFTTVGAVANRYKAPAGVRVDYTWSDGTPTASASTTTGVYLQGIGNRFELSVPADTTAKTLTLYAGAYKAQGRLDFSLSDGSASPTSLIIDNPTGPIDRAVTVSFAAASAGQSLRITYTLLNGNNITLAGAALAGGGGTPSITLPFTEDFNDTLDNWVFVDETDKASSWAIVSGELHQQNRVESVNAFDQSYHLGTFGYISDGQALTDYTLTVDALYLSNGLAEDIGVMFRYQDSNNYYRLALNSRYGFTRLEKKVGGQFTPLATNARGYMAGELLQIKIEAAGSSIKIYLNGDPLFAVTDSSLASGTIALYTQDNAKFDNVLVDTNATTPTVVIASPIAHSVITGASLQVTASAENVPANGFVEFILDDSTSLTDNTAPFTRTFTSVGAGTHKVDAILRDQANVEMARDTNVDIATQGDYMVAVGDSISNGIGDNYATDNLAMFGRIIAFQGFEAPLTDKLNVNEAFANNLVANEGVGGDESFDAAFTRIDSILVRHPETNQTLILLGTNDALSIIPPGLGCSGTGCDGTFKGNLQTLVDKITWLDYPTNTVPSNIMPIVSLIPPAWNSSNPWNSITNNRIRNYNTVITTELSGITVGADLFSYFMPSAAKNYASLFADTLHPNGFGEEVTSCLLYNAINAASPLPLPFVLDDLTASTPSAPKQNLLEAGDQYYLDETFTLTNIPAILQNGRWVMLANADSTNTSGTYLSFTVDRAVDVYIAYDNGATLLPGWMTGFTDTGLLVSTTDPSTPDLRLYKKNFSAGATTLGGNLQGSATGANSNYVAIVVAM